MRISRLRAGVVALTVAAMLISGVAVGLAGTGWQTFGSGWATNRGGGTGGSPDIWMSSVTKADPADVRYTIKNHASQSRKVQVFWDLDCWKKDANGFNDSVTSKSGDFTATIGGGNTLIKSPTYGASAKWCQLDVWVDYAFADFGENGKITLKFQAKY